MAKRNDPVSRARGRKPAPVKKPFPVGFALGSAALAALLIGVLVYAVANAGVGDKSSLKYAENQINGLQVTHGLARKHVEGSVNYPHQADTPPDGGDHNGNPQSCQVYTAAIANEHALHSLEHGAVWVTYNPNTASAADIATLKGLVDGNPDRLLSPYPGLKTTVSLQAWGERLFVDSASDTRVKRFLELFTKGRQAPEPNASCVGTTATGPIAATPATPSASPSATMNMSPSPAASKK